MSNTDDHDSEKTPSAGASTFGWLSKFRSLSDDYVLNHHSLDAYLYVRFLKMLTLMAFVGAIVTWPVLFPVNATGAAGELGLDILSFSNISDSNPARYFAHAVIAWVFFGWVMFLIGREMMYLVKVRQAYLLSTWNASRISQRTVLFTDIPDKELSLERLHTNFPDVAQIWLVPDVSELEEDVEDLEETIPKLESSEIKLMRKVTKEHNKIGEKASSFYKTLRPTHRLKFLVGEKVDSISYYRKHIGELLPKIRYAQRAHLAGKKSLTNAIFVEFDTMAAAERAFTDNQHRRPTKFSPRQIGVLPDEVIWKNLGMGAKNRMLRHLAATIAISALIIFWSIPVAVVGIISNVNYLTENVPFLGFINNIPDVILGVVTGLLPVVALAILMTLVPVICRCESKFTVDEAFETIANITLCSLSEALRCSHAFRSRGAMPEVVLCFSSDSSLLNHNVHLRSRCGSQSDRQRSYAGCSFAVPKPAQGFELLHLILHPLRSRQRSPLSVQHDGSLGRSRSD